VGFLAENSILCITSTSFGARFSLAQNFNLLSFIDISLTQWVKIRPEGKYLNISKMGQKVAILVKNDEK